MEIGNKNAVHVENLRGPCHISSEIQSGKNQEDLYQLGGIFVFSLLIFFLTERLSLCNFWHLIKQSMVPLLKPQFLWLCLALHKHLSPQISSCISVSNFKYSQAHYFFDKIILVAISKRDVQIILSLPQFHRSFKNNPTLHNSTFVYLELYTHISVKSCSSPIISYFHMASFQVTQHIMAKDPLGKGNSRQVNKWDYILLMNIKSLKT